MSPTYYLYLSAVLFSIGAAGVLVRRNSIVVFMCIELMLNAVNLSLVTFSRLNGNLDGQVIAFFVMVVAAAEVVVGLAIIVSIFRTRRSASVDDPNLSKCGAPKTSLPMVAALPGSDSVPPNPVAARGVFDLSVAIILIPLISSA